ADWLEEHGGEREEARARLIRVQCQRARLAEDDPAQPALEAEEEQLLDRWERKFLKEGPSWAKLPKFRRGIVAEAAGTGPDWARSAGALRQAAPLESAFIHPISAEDEAGVAGSPHLAGLEWVALRALGEAGARALAASPHVEGLRGLRLLWGHIGAGG